MKGAEDESSDANSRNNWREQDPLGLTLKVPDGVRILVVCEDDSDTER